MNQRMNVWGFVAALAVLSLSSCGLSSEKEAVIARAGSIQEFPVSRAVLTATLGLGNQPGNRHDVRIRGRRVSSSETWQHPAGLTIAAYATTMSRREIGEVLLGRVPDEPGLSEESSLPDEFGLHDEAVLPDELGLPGEPVMPSASSASESFDRFEVKDGKKVLFRSGEGDVESTR